MIGASRYLKRLAFAIAKLTLDGGKIDFVWRMKEFATLDMG